MKKQEKVKVILELDLKVMGTKEVQTLRKSTSIFIAPFPGLIIDDDSLMRKDDMRIPEHRVIIKEVRCSMVKETVLCYCETLELDTAKKKDEVKTMLLRLDWKHCGFPG